MPASPPPLPKPPRRGPLKNLAMLVLGAVSALYLTYPSFGLFELLPDAIPGVGHVDEALATLLLLKALAYFGLNVGGFVRARPKNDEGPVIDIDPPK